MLNEPELICLHTVKWFHVQWMIKLYYLTNWWDLNIPGLSGPRSHANEEVLYITQSSRINVRSVMITAVENGYGNKTAFKIWEKYEYNYYYSKHR